MTIRQALHRLQHAPVQHLPLADLRTDPQLQPRVSRVIPFREQARTEQQSETHTGHLRLTLEAAHHVQLEPILAAEIAGTLYVVDGHHRLTAYRRAQRETIPVRVQRMSRPAAVLVSKLVNCSDRALAMHPEQQREAAWQYLAAITQHGKQQLPEGESLRTVAGLFGIGKDTVGRMLRKLPQTRPTDYSPESWDAGTGFPRWRYVREAGTGWHDMKEKLSVEQITQHEAEKLAKRLGNLLDKATPKAAQIALAILDIEARMEAANQDTKDFQAETEEATDF